MPRRHAHPALTEAPGAVIRFATADDWRERRRLRLEMLGDTPIAFCDRLEQSLAIPDEEWRRRAEHPMRPGSCTALAVDTESGLLVGTMSSFVRADGRANLVTVYVSPGHRGQRRGVTDALLDATEQWVAQQTAAPAILLLVHEHNAAARRFYLRRGYTETGRSSPYVLDPAARDLEMSSPVTREVRA